MIIRQIRKIELPTIEYRSDIEMVNAFLSVVPWCGGYVGAFRSFNPDNFAHETVISIGAWSDEWNLIELQEHCVYGEDPRAVLQNGHPYIVYAHWNGVRHDQYLLNLQTGQNVKLKFNDREFLGKNWSPLEFQDRQYLITAFDPLDVVLIDTISYCEPVIRNEYTVGSIGSIRGGSRGLQVSSEESWFLTHNTYHYQKHTPVLTRWNQSGLHHEELNWPHALGDPTSLWIENNKIYGIIASCDQSWHPGRNQIDHWLVEIVNPQIETVEVKNFYQKPAMYFGQTFNENSVGK